MSDEAAEDGFLTRWSRRKRDAAAAPVEPTDAAPVEPGPEPPTPVLPPIESLDAGSDYAAFFQAGVPEEVKRLGLRRAWLTDPAITEYRSLADYDWDFNQADYGQLAETADDIREMVRSVFGTEPEPSDEVTKVAQAESPDGSSQATLPEEPPPAAGA